MSPFRLLQEHAFERETGASCTLMYLNNIPSSHVPSLILFYFPVNRHNADLIGLRFPTNLGAKVGSEVAIASVIAET